MIDLVKAAVLVLCEADSRTNAIVHRAAKLLRDSVRDRAGVLWPIIDREDSATADTPRIIIGLSSAVQSVTGFELPDPGGNTHPEAFQLRTVEGTGPIKVCIAGNTPRAVLFGVGKLLRTLQLNWQRVECPAGLRLHSAPATSLRGHQLGYRPKNNTYDGFDEALWEQHLRDLIVFGCNAIEILPPRTDDEDHSPLYPLPAGLMMQRLSQLADDYDLQVSVWYPIPGVDLGLPSAADAVTEDWQRTLGSLPRVDEVFVPGGDPGHTAPEILFPLLERCHRVLTNVHPHATLWVSPQGFIPAWLEKFHELVAQRPSWLGGVVYGPEIRVTLEEFRNRIPREVPIRHYPDISHSRDCQYPVPDWDWAFNLTEGREIVNPRPQDMARIFSQFRCVSDRFIAYSEGCHDDVNKAIWSALGWDPNADVVGLLRDYGNYFIGIQFADAFAHGLLALESNWQGPAIANAGICITLRQFQSMDRVATPRQRLNWRFQQAMYRAHFDAYVRTRLLYETHLEALATECLRASPRLGSRVALREAQIILDRALTEPVARDLRTRLGELAEALFQSVRMQLSVARYYGQSFFRGANLDEADVPLNDRAWLTGQLQRISTIPTEAERLAEIDRLINRTNPGPGGFYDNLGDPTLSPHLLRGPHPGNTLAMNHPIATIGERWHSEPDVPLAWRRTAGTLYDQPMHLQYDALDPQAHYRLTVAYGTHPRAWPIRLLANDQCVLHDFTRFEAQAINISLPQSVTRTGRLRLTWQAAQDQGFGGRGMQVAEVLLQRVDKPTTSIGGAVI